MLSSIVHVEVYRRYIGVFLGRFMLSAVGVVALLLPLVGLQVSLTSLGVVPFAAMLYAVWCLTR